MIVGASPADAAKHQGTGIQESSSQLCLKPFAMVVRRFELPKLSLNSVLCMTKQRCVNVPSATLHTP